MIEVAFCGETTEDLRTQMLDFLGMTQQTVVVNQAHLKTAEVKPAEKVKAEPKPVEPVKAEPAKPAEAATAVTPGYKEIADYVPKAVSKYGRGKIVTLLEGFGAKTGKDLKSEQYPEVLAKLKAEFPL
jgi:hypothetical protein